MKLQNLKLTNFRGYYKEQSLQFSTDVAQNVTVINGNTGEGMTRFDCLSELEKEALILTVSSCDKKQIEDRYNRANGELKRLLAFHLEEGTIVTSD